MDRSKIFHPKIGQSMGHLLVGKITTYGIAHIFFRNKTVLFDKKEFWFREPQNQKISAHSDNR